MIGGLPLRAVRVAIGTVLLGVAIGLAAFLATSGHPPYRYLGPFCATLDELPGFDPSTGEPHGRRFLCSLTVSPDEAAYWVTVPTPAELVGRRAIALPVGIPVGVLAVAVGVACVSWRRRRQGPPALAANLELRTLLAAVAAASLGVLALAIAGAAWVLLAVILGLALLRPVRTSAAPFFGVGELEPGRIVTWATETAAIAMVLLLAGSFGLLVTMASAALGLALLFGGSTRPSGVPAANAPYVGPRPAEGGRMRP